MLKTSGGIKKKQFGFTIVEVLVSLSVVSILLLTAGTVVVSTATLNAKTNLNADASEAAFQKMQGYVNTSYDNIPIGLVGSSYEVEDFSTAPEVTGLSNATAKVYVQPMSVVDTGTTTTTNDYTEVAVADTTFSNGAEISASGTIDPTNCCRRDYRLNDNNYYNLVYNNYSPGSSNQEMPAIDLGSSQAVNTIRINWYTSSYTSQDFRIEASNDGSTWTTVASGLSANAPANWWVGDYPEDFTVSGTYRYWRMFNVTGTNGTWIAISEFEAFAAATGDVVEQNGSDASVNPGAIDFTSSDLEMSENGTQGHQSIGLRFKSINVSQGTSITKAYVQFTAKNTDSVAVELLATGQDTDNAVGWDSSSYAVDNSVSGVNGTTSTTTWNPSSWTAGDSGTAQQLNATSIVQEILNRGGWVRGNRLAIAIQNVAGTGRRVAEKANAPSLVIEWSETTTVTNGGTYVDANGDGDADNPTLLKVRTVVSYDSFGERREVEYTTFIRKYGIGG